MRLASGARLSAAQRRAHWSEARGSLGRSLEILLALRQENRLRAPDAGRIDSLTRALALCDARTTDAHLTR